MNKEDVKALALVIVWDVVVLMCFTALAIIFKQWWIVVFSALFYKSFTYKKDNKGGKE